MPTRFQTMQYLNYKDKYEKSSKTAEDEIKWMAAKKAYQAILKREDKNLKRRKERIVTYDKI